MMNALREILSSGWAHALGWTLLHSIWQALIVLGLILAAMRLIPSMRSALRYSLACAGLILFLVMSAVTFMEALGDYPVAASEQSTSATLFHHAAFQERPTQEVGMLPLALSTLERNMQWVVMAWAAGFIFFALRLSLGLWYTYRLRSTAELIGGQWQEFICTSAEKLGITKFVRLAESAAIVTPMVIGFLKPLILVPAGMLAGLTPTQVETVLVHELAHIRRNDFLVNFLQTAIEAIFFFNPFVWMLSNEIRKEREYCCDDLVVTRHGDSSAYAHALVQLAEARLAPPMLAIPLANDRNILLNRIKRIMEKSIKRPGKGRLVLPAIVLVLGLISISWIAIDKKDGKGSDTALAAQDTVVDKKNNGARYSRRSIITIDENGLAQEHIQEEFEGDEHLRAMMARSIPSGFDRSLIAGFPDFPSAPFDGITALQDTIPPFRGRDWEGWAESFNEEFEELFNLKGQQFIDLEELKDEIEKIEKFHSKNWSEWEKSLHENFHHDSLGAFADSIAFKGLEDLEQQLQQLREFKLESFNDFGDAFHSLGKAHADEQTLRDELVEDGYLSRDEAINSLEWNEDHFKVNGKKVRPEDLKKYNELRESIFGSRGSKKAE